MRKYKPDNADGTKGEPIGIFCDWCEKGPVERFIGGIGGELCKNCFQVFSSPLKLAGELRRTINALRDDSHSDSGGSDNAAKPQVEASSQSEEVPAATGVEQPAPPAVAKRSRGRPRKATPTEQSQEAAL